MSNTFILMSVDYTEARDRVTHIFRTSKDRDRLVLEAKRLNQGGGRILTVYLYPIHCSDEIPRRTKESHFWIQEVEDLDE